MTFSIGGAHFSICLISELSSDVDKIHLHGIENKYVSSAKNFDLIPISKTEPIPT